MIKGGRCAGITGRMCSDKFKNLKTRYKTIKARSNQTGNGGESRQSNWPYFEKMHELLLNDAAVNPDNVYEFGAAGFNRIRRSRICFLNHCMLSLLYLLIFMHLDVSR